MIKYNIDKFIEIEKLPQDKINIYGSNLKQNNLKKLLGQSRNKTEPKIVDNKDVWVAPSLNHNQTNYDEKTKLHLLLSQLTEKNKDQIFENILTIIKINDNLNSLIYKSAIQQDYYSEIYSKLCVFIRDNIINKNSFEKEILDFLENFFKCRLEQDIKYQNYVKFISFLNVNNFISKKIIKECISNILTNIKNSNINTSEEITSLYNIYSITKILLEPDDRIKLEELSKDKNKIVLSKDRFKIIDILELEF